MRRDYGGDAVTPEEWARVFAAFGPHVPDANELARQIRNPAVGAHGMELMRRFDAGTEVSAIRCPTLVCVGELDGMTPPPCAEEIVAALPPGVGRLEVIPGAGHFPWLDAPEQYWERIADFVSPGNDTPRG